MSGAGPATSRPRRWPLARPSRWPARPRCAANLPAARGCSPPSPFTSDPTPLCSGNCTANRTRGHEQGGKCAVARAKWAWWVRPSGRGGPAGPWTSSDDAAPLDAQPAAVGELRQRLVDRLAAGADELRQLFLRQVVLHAHALVLVLTELVGQIEQRLRHAAGNVAEDEVGHRFVRTPQPLRQRTQQAGRRRQVVRAAPAAGRRGPATRACCR